MTPELGNTSLPSTPMITQTPLFLNPTTAIRVWQTSTSNSYPMTIKVPMMTSKDMDWCWDQWIHSPAMTTTTKISTSTPMVKYQNPTWETWNRTGAWYPKQTYRVDRALDRWYPETEWVFLPDTHLTHWADPQWTRWNTVVVETEEQKLLRAEQERQWRAEREARMADAEAARLIQDEQRRAAHARAEALLHLHLDERQRRDLLQHGYFDVISNLGRRWRIRASGLTANVDLMPEQGEVRLASYCAHPPQDGEPIADHFLAQKFFLETDEERFTDVAYIHHQAQGAVIPLPRRNRPAA